MLVEEDVVDVMGRVSNVIVPHECFTGYKADENKIKGTESWENSTID